MQSHHSAITPSPTPAPSAGRRRIWAGPARASVPCRPARAPAPPVSRRHPRSRVHRFTPPVNHQTCLPPSFPATRPGVDTCAHLPIWAGPLRPAREDPRGPEHLGPRAGMNRPISPPSPPHPLLTRSPERCRPARDNPSIHQRKAPARSPVPYRSGSSHPLPPTPCTLSSSPHRPPLAVLPFG